MELETKRKDSTQLNKLQSKGQHTPSNLKYDLRKETTMKTTKTILSSKHGNIIFETYYKWNNQDDKDFTDVYYENDKDAKVTIKHKEYYQDTEIGWYSTLTTIKNFMKFATLIEITEEYLRNEDN